MKLSQPIPASIELRALIDTGAYVTLLDGTGLETLTQLLTPQMWLPVHGVNPGTSTQLLPAYELGLSLVFNGVATKEFTLLLVVSAMFSAATTAPYQALLGRDFLRYIDFHYEGFHQSVTIGVDTGE